MLSLCLYSLAARASRGDRGGMTKSFWAASPWVKIGLLAVIVLYFAMVLYQAISLRIGGAADSYAHMDYVWQVFNGHLPTGYGYELEGRRGPSETERHLTAAHPPLFYVILAVIVGPILATGDWELATVVARGFNIILGFGVLIAIAWAAWRLGGALRNQLVIVAPAMGVLVVAFIRVAGDNYNDILVVLLGTIALTVACIILKEGPATRYLVVLVVVSVLGMATRATYIATFGLTMLALAAAVIIHLPTMSLRRRIAKIAVWWATTAVLVIASIGWFYLRNQEASGSWFRSRPKQAVIARDYKSLTDNLTNPEFYTIVPGRLLGIRNWDGILPINYGLSLAISIVCIIGLVVWLRRGARWRRVTRSAPSIAIVALLAVQMLALYVMQLQHATGWGNLNPRYFLPGLLVTALILAIGSLAWRRLRGLLASAIIGVMAVSGMIDSVWYNSRFNDDPSLPTFLILGSVAGVCTIVVAVALFRLTRVQPTPADELIPVERVLA